MRHAEISKKTILEYSYGCFQIQVQLQLQEKKVLNSDKTKRWFITKLSHLIFTE